MTRQMIPRRSGLDLAHLGLAVGCLAFAASGALGQGFAVSDMAEVEVDTSLFTSGEFVALPKQNRLLVACLECKRTSVVELKMTEGGSEDEADLRMGRITFADMQGACQAAQDSPVCLGVETAQLGEAIGWVTMTRVGINREIRTYELFQGGQRLTIQAIAETREEADALGRIAFDHIAPQIIGGN